MRHVLFLFTLLVLFATLGLAASVQFDNPQIASLRVSRQDVTATCFIVGAICVCVIAALLDESE
jgi:uncharacterized protein HemY